MITDTTGVFKIKELPELETGQSRYVMASNGIFYEQNDDLFSGSDSIHTFYRDVNFGSLNLIEHQAFFQPKFPIVPASMISQCLGFFKYIEDKHDCECGLVLLYDPELRVYHWCCPEQEISSCNIDFKVPLPGRDYEENLVHFGDIHLHPGMSAYHSYTDEKDEMTASDGLHLVVGTPKHKTGGQWSDRLRKWVYDDDNEDKTEFCAVFVSDGARFKCQPQDVIELTTETSAFPPSWLKKCHKKKQETWFGGGGKKNNGGGRTFVDGKEIFDTYE